jgi:hypothetical protein
MEADPTFAEVRDEKEEEVAVMQRRAPLSEFLR